MTYCKNSYNCTDTLIIVQTTARMCMHIMSLSTSETVSQHFTNGYFQFF